MEKRHPNPYPPVNDRGSKGEAADRRSREGGLAAPKAEQSFRSCSSACETGDPRSLNNNNNSERDALGGEAQSDSAKGSRSYVRGSPAFSDVSVLRVPSSSSSSSAARLKAGDAKQSDPMLSNYVTERQSETSLGRRSSSGKRRGPGSPDFPGISGTPTSISQLLNLPSSAFSLDGLEFPSPLGSGTMLGRKRPLSSISPLSASSLDLNSLIRSSPTSLLNCITSRGSSAGSMGHLSPALFANPALFQPAFSRPALSLRNTAHPGASNLSQPSSGGLVGGGDAEPVSIKQEEMDESEAPLLNGGDSLIQRVKQEMEMMGGEPEELEHERGLSSQPLETVQEEATSEDEGMQTDPTDYSSALTENDSELETKPGGTRDRDKPRRIYYSYPSVEEPHNNQCRWAKCSVKCEAMDDLVLHVNNDHIYRESQKEFVCHWSGCVRERRPFKAQYMLLVHMRRHTGEKPHKCTYESCDKAYSRLENLKTHLRSHTGERPYVCRVDGCGKAFSNASDCAKHMNRTHSDEKPYACPNAGCTKRYTDPSSRRKHMKNCQANKRPRTDDRDSMSGADEEGGAETAGMPLAAAQKKVSKAKKPDKKKPPSSSAAMPKSYPFKLNSDPDCLSGGSQAYCPTATGGYNSSGYETDPYPSFRSEEAELALFLRQQRLSDPMDTNPALTYPPGPRLGKRPGSMPAHNQMPPSSSPVIDHTHPNGLAGRLNGGVQAMPAGQPMPHPPHLQPHTPSYQHHRRTLSQGPFLPLPSTLSTYLPSFPASCPSNPSVLSAGYPAPLPSSLSGLPLQPPRPPPLQPAHARTRLQTEPSPPPPAMAAHRETTASSGYGSSCGYSPKGGGGALGGGRGCKSPSDDGSSMISSQRSSLMTGSYSTLSTNSSRVPSPCGSSGRADPLHLAPHHPPSSPLPPHFMPHGTVMTGNFPLRHSLRNLPSNQHHGHPPAPYSTTRRSSVGSDRSWRTGTSSLCSSSGSELSEDLLDSLPSRPNSFAKQQPLPLPDSMQSGFPEPQGMELSQFSPMSDGGEAYFSERSPMQFNGYSQVLSPAHSQGLSPATQGLSPATQGLSPATQGLSPATQGLSTFPLHHYGAGRGGGGHELGAPGQLFGGGLSQSGGYVPAEESYDMNYMEGLRGTCTSPNMVMGDMNSFAHSLPEETQYLESLLHAQVK